MSYHALRRILGGQCNAFAIFTVFVVLALPSTPHAQDAALTFDGIDDLATIPSTNNWPSSTSSLTVEAWIRPSDLSRHEYIAIVRGGGISFTLQQHRTDTSAMVWTISRGATHSAQSPTGALVEGRWDHFAGTYDGTTMRIYQNGDLVAEEDHTLPGNVQVRGDLLLAFRPGSPNFAGTIDEVRVWLTVRTQEQIKGSFGRTLTGAEPDLIGYWRLGEGVGQVISDSSTIANDGVLGTTTAVEPEDPLWTDQAAPLAFFFDGFENGDTDGWSTTVW